MVDIFTRNDVKFISAEQAGLPKSLLTTNYYDIAPRAGFAYRLFDGRKQLVIRGGYGLYYSKLPMRARFAQLTFQPPFLASFSNNPNSAAQSPDGIPNYLLRSAPTIVAGVNSANVVDLNNPLSIGRGVADVGLADKRPTPRIHEWNLTIEKQLSRNTVFRVNYAGKHGVHMEQYVDINPQANDYIWYVTTGEQIPTGPFAGVARRVYDQTAYTSVRIIQRDGYINSSLFSFELQRRFNQGLSFQAFYTRSHALRLAGNSVTDDIGTSPQVFLPGTVPTDPQKLNRLLFYDRDLAIPRHRVRWNWTYELPVGKGKPLMGNASGFLNGLIGGWQLSGVGTLLQGWYAMPTNHWGEFGNFEVYGKKYKILDCRGTPANATAASQERCTPGYLWFNGYISERFINSKNAAGLRNGVFGLPDNYRPAQKPRNPWPKGGRPTDPGAADYDTNVAYLNLKNGSTVRVNYDLGVHPWRNQYLLAPTNWSLDASLMKFIPIKERLKLRVNLDVFNVFNRQGFNAPNSEGISSLGSSFGAAGFTPRQLQGALRLEW